MTHLYQNSDLKERQYPFRDRCSRSIEIKEVVRLPEYTEVAYKPAGGMVSGTGADFKGFVEIDDESIQIYETGDFKKRIYLPEDWGSYREAVAIQKSISDEPIILKRK